MTVYGLTHRGAVRKENQDSLRFELQEGREVLTAVLCDGMGGARAGSVASTIAVNAFMSHAANSLDERSSGADMRAILSEAVDYANKKVYERGVSDLECMGMGSTLVAALISGRRAMVANVGDSRAYLLSKRKIRQITTDHSLVEDMIARGKLTREQARTHPQKNIITRAVGVEPAVKCDIFDVKLAPENTLLLCSDGLSNIVTDAEILAACQTDTPVEQICEGLLNLALSRGAPDNVTVFLARR